MVVTSRKPTDGVGKTLETFSTFPTCPPQKAGTRAGPQAGKRASHDPAPVVLGHAMPQNRQ